MSADDREIGGEEGGEKGGVRGPGTPVAAAGEEELPLVGEATPGGRVGRVRDCGRCCRVAREGGVLGVGGAEEVVELPDTVLEEAGLGGGTVGGPLLALLGVGG